MKKILVFLTLVLAIFSCSKTEQKIKEDIIIKAMTDGQWRVTRFVKGGIDVTPDFSAYKFQFRSNNTVEALQNGTLEKTGDWNADPAARTITSNFTNASATVTLLNGTWQITNNSWTFVEATQTVNGEVRTLRLDK